MPIGLFSQSKLHIFTAILTSDNDQILNYLGNFIKIAFERRKSNIELLGNINEAATVVPGGR